MEDHKDELILILAGYQKEMERFIQINPGIRSRFPIHIDFPDYSQTELLEIAEQMCARRQYQLAAPTRLALLRMLALPVSRDGGDFGNARTVRNIIEKALRRQAVRLVAQGNLTREQLMLIEPGDLPEVE